MTITFTGWPLSSQGRIAFTANCPCGRDAVWEQIGLGELDRYEIFCPCPIPAAPIPAAPIPAAPIPAAPIPAAPIPAALAS